MSDLDPNKIKKSLKKKKEANFDQPNVFFNVIHHFIEGFVNERYHEKEKLYQERVFHEKSFVSLFLRKIKRLFTKERGKDSVEKEELKLLGRIRELDEDVDNALDLLNSYKQDLKKEVDEGLYPFVESVMNPMVRDILRVQKIVKKEGVIQRKMEALNQYTAWLDRAKLFVQVCTTSKNKKVIEETIIAHTLQDFKDLIDKDLQLIQDYEEHQVGGLVGIQRATKAELQKKIKKSLKPYIKSLMNLKKEPENLTLENLNEWKEEADKSRSSYFNAVLQVIDNKIKKFNPKEEKGDESDLLMEVLAETIFLEKEIPALIKKLKENFLSEEEFTSLEREVTLTELLVLSEEVDELYHDIKMPQEVIKRLSSLKKLLDKTFSKIQPK